MDVVVGLGANLGDAHATLVSAVRDVSTFCDVVRVSSLYETDPVGPPQPVFFNAALVARTEHSAVSFLAALRDVEHRHGRTRAERWGPRTLDLDILWISCVVVEETSLQVPHPRLCERQFALVPLLEIVPDAVHPGTGEALSMSLSRLPKEGVRQICEPRWAGLISRP